MVLFGNENQPQELVLDCLQLKITGEWRGLACSYLYLLYSLKLLDLSLFLLFNGFDIYRKSKLGVEGFFVLKWSLAFRQQKRK